MQRNKSSAPSPRRSLTGLARLVVFSSIGLACLGTVFAVGRSSTHYRMVIDATTMGGGPTASASYEEVDSAVGQEADGFGSSASFREQAGVVLGWNQVAGPTPHPTSALLGIGSPLWRQLP